MKPVGSIATRQLSLGGGLAMAGYTASLDEPRLRGLIEVGRSLVAELDPEASSARPSKWPAS